MIKTTLGQLKQSEKAVAKLMNQETDIKTAYSLGRIVNKIGQELRDSESARIKLVEKHGTKDDKGQSVVPEENKKVFYEEYSKLLEVEVEMPFSKVSIESLSKVSVTPAEMVQLDYLILESDQIPEIVEEVVTEEPPVEDAVVVE